MGFRVLDESGEYAVRAFPSPEDVDVATLRLHERGELDSSAVYVLGDISLRASWYKEDDDWQRALTTDLQKTISLPDEPGSALYIRPGLRRFCAAFDEVVQGIWDRTVVVGDGPKHQTYARNVGLQGAEFGIYGGDDLGKAFADTREDGLQLVCFDSVDGKADGDDARRVVRYAADELEVGGLLVIGGVMRKELGRSSLISIVDAALETFDLEYEQEDASGQYRAVLAR